MKTTVHIISHSHWDREWYLPFEKHRLKLVELIDNILEQFETNPDFKSFFLDGQTIALDDYLEIRPERKADIEKYVSEGRLFTGPWYILQDEFLTDGESCVRNLLTGMAEGEKYGRVSHVGYFPDAFGNAGQMPQVLKQAGMEAVAFGRGVKPVGFNNEAGTGKYESAYSEMNWESSDGSGILGILFANWYHNGMEIPVEEDKARAYWDERLKKARAFAGTSQLLFMNGCDHQPLQKNLTEAMETARRLYPDIEFVHSDFETYARAVKKELGDKASTVTGELTSQETDGRFTLVNTCSSWVDLKKKNREGEGALIRRGEPAALMAALAGKEYPEDQLRYSWKKLMQNHPHDSICGCSVDEVNHEINTRFAKSRQVAESIYAESLSYLGEQIDTASLVSALAEKLGEKIKVKEKWLPVAVFNTFGQDRTAMVDVVLDYERFYKGNFEERFRAAEAIELPPMKVYTPDGQVVEAYIEDLGVKFGYELPEDRFRQPYMARQIKVSFLAENVPAEGYRVYVVRGIYEGEEIEDRKEKIGTAEGVLQNKYLTVKLHLDGSYDVTSLADGRTYRNLGIFEDTGDMGNEYIYIQDTGHKTITSAGKAARITLEENNTLRAIYRIEQELEIPVSMGEELDKLRRRCVDLYARKAERSEKTAVLKLITRLTLEKESKGLKAAVTLENQMKDHRVRVLFPTGLQTEKHMADSAFEVVRRNNRHSKKWENPSGCEHQQCFVAMEDPKGGLLIANRGMYEYEILPDQDNTIAVTLLRAVGEMGDWGDFPTPAAQMQGTYTQEYEIVPFKAGEAAEAFEEAYAYQESLTGVQLGMKDAFRDRSVQPWLHTGSLPAEKGFLHWQGKGLHLTAFKRGDRNRDGFVRFVNTKEEPVTLTLFKEEWFSKVYLSNVLEKEWGDTERLVQTESGIQIEVKPYEILTLGLVR